MSSKNPAENHGAMLLGQSATPFCWYGGRECDTIYASTRMYKTVLEAYGWGDLTDR